MPRAGQRVGRYELIRLLGKGGMGQVWLARGEVIPGAARTVALKFFQVDPDDALDTFMSEARVAMLLTHSNIVQVFDAGDSDSGRYLVMEWVEGVDLGQIWKGEREQGRRIELATAVFILAQVLRGLHYAHGLRRDGRLLRIVHRDVSPQNVLISVSGEVKLADFGIARSALHATTGTHIKGKLRYMPLEQLEGEPLTAAADLYAVGAMFHELVSNDPFRTGRTVEELCMKIAAAEIPELAEALPEELERIRRQLLARAPEDRFASAEEALRALESWPSFRDRTFTIAELCQRHAPDGQDHEVEHAATRRVGDRSGARGDALRENTDAARVEAMDREPARRRWPIAAAMGLMVSAATVAGVWRPWERAQEPVAVASTPDADAGAAPREPAPREAPAPNEPTREAAPAPSADVEPSIAVGAPPGDESTPRPSETPTGSEAPTRKQDRRPRTRASSDPGTPPTDAKVLASVRGAARKACAGRQGDAEIRIDFLIEADGRPALLRSSSPGDARSECIEGRLRGARFAEGSGRRASLRVSFEP